MKVVVLGGAGKMGVIAVEDLILNKQVDKVVIADREGGVAKRVADYLKSPKLIVEQIDLNDHNALVNLLRDADSCVNATVYYHNLKVMNACLEAKTHYTDLGGLFHLTREQLKLHERFVESGISAILGMGSAPGIPNLQSRYAADRLDKVESIHIFDGIQPPKTEATRFTYAVPTIIDEMTLAPMVFRDGAFKECEPMAEFEDYWFSPPLGMLPMHLSLHSEVATLPISFQSKGVKDCFFKINYWGMTPSVVEKVNTLIDFGFASKQEIELDGIRLTPHDFLLKMMSGFVPDVLEYLAPPTNSPPDWTKEIVTEIQGTRDGKQVTYRIGTLMVKGALPTGVVPARAAVWLALGRISPGVYPPERALDPEPFLKEIEDRDIYTQVTEISNL